MHVAAAGNAFDLDAFLAAERSAVGAALTRGADGMLEGAPAELADPVRYALAGGGKRLRPILCVAAYRASGGSEAGPAVYDLAVPLELIHTYSLVHDDLPCMDDDELRRGRPTTHQVYGVPRAMVAGAALIPLACLALDRGGQALGLTADERSRLVRELCAAAGSGGMVGGQLLDLEAEGRQVEQEELEAIHRRKTGALLAASLRIGGLAARAEPPVLEALESYGRAVGLAFQIADDVLDVMGRAAELGKAAGRDRALGKATYAALLGVPVARARAGEEAESAIEALRRAAIDAPALEALARFAVERDR